MVTDKKIGVLMGGTSAEKEVSIKSGIAVYNALKNLKYNVIAIDAGRDICEVLRREKIEIAFLTLHGGCGENGSIQGLLEVMDIPYTGSGVLASALAMDKEVSKKIFMHHGIPVPPFRVVTRASLNVTGQIGFEMPWVVKPATEGSSIGVTIVKDGSVLNEAMEKTMDFGDRIIIEKYIEGKEIQVGILNDRILGAVEVRPKVEFYSYEAKYTAGLTDYILPPELENRVLGKAEKDALSAHMALGCGGATRVDLIVDREGNSHVLEVNTIPGMTETSLLPKIAGLSGLNFPLLVEEILKEAVSRKR